MYAIVVIAAIIVAMSIFGMAKWTSVLFSDIRNKLGDQVVFTAWKGRSVMRKYIKPANPNSLKQQARRDINRQGVVNWQSNVGTDAERLAAWNELALPRQISGFNLFMKYLGQIKIASEDAETTGSSNTITYTIPVDLSIMGLFRAIDAADLTEIQTAGELTAGADQTYNNIDTGTPGTYTYFIGPSAMFDTLTGGDEVAAFCAHWTADETNGVALPASTVFTAP